MELITNLGPTAICLPLFPNLSDTGFGAIQQPGLGFDGRQRHPDGEPGLRRLLDGEHGFRQLRDRNRGLDCVPRPRECENRALFLCMFLLLLLLLPSSRKECCNLSISCMPMLRPAPNRSEATPVVTGKQNVRSPSLHTDHLLNESFGGSRRSVLGVFNTHTHTQFQWVWGV